MLQFPSSTMVSRMYSPNNLYGGVSHHKSPISTLTSVLFGRAKRAAWGPTPHKKFFQPILFPYVSLHRIARSRPISLGSCSCPSFHLLRLGCYLSFLHLLEMTSFELVEPLGRVAEVDEAIYSKMDIVRASGGIRPPVTGHFIGK